MIQKAVKKIIGWGLFLLGAYGVSLIPQLKHLIAKCDETVFTVVILSVIYFTFSHFQEKSV